MSLAHYLATHHSFAQKVLEPVYFVAVRVISWIVFQSGSKTIYEITRTDTK